MSNQAPPDTSRTVSLKDAVVRSKRVLATYMKARDAEQKARAEVYECCKEMIEVMLQFMSGSEIGSRSGVTKSYICRIRYEPKEGGYKILGQLIKAAGAIKK